MTQLTGSSFDFESAHNHFDCEYFFSRLGHPDALYGPLHAAIDWEAPSHRQQDQRGLKSRPVKLFPHRRHSNTVSCTTLARRPPPRPLETKSDSTIIRWQRHGNLRKVSPPRITALTGQPQPQPPKATAREPIAVGRLATPKPRRWTPPEKGPYITANEALAHALSIEKPIQDALSALGIGNEYVIQVGFNKEALQKGIVLEELYLTLNGDLPTLNRQALSEAMTAIFSPFPGVVYTINQLYHIPIDPPTQFCHVSALGGFTLSTSTGTNTGAVGEGIFGGNGNEERKGKSREVPREDGNNGSKDEGGYGDDEQDNSGDPDPGQPSGGGSSPGGLELTLKSKVTIKAGDHISHIVSMQLDALIKVSSLFQCELSITCHIGWFWFRRQRPWVVRPQDRTRHDQGHHSVRRC
jgi:hypothetical protein